MRTRLLLAFTLAFFTAEVSAQQWLGGSTSSSAIYRTGNVAVGSTLGDYRMRLNNGDVQILIGYGGADPDGVGDHLFRIFNSQGQVFGVSSYATLQNKLITDLGVNYAVNGVDGVKQFVTNGSKKAPYIRLNAEDGSISLFGENGSGSNFRLASSKLGVFVKNTGSVGIGTYDIPPDGRLAVEGKLYSREVIVNLDVWSDYVFEPDYRLMPVEELARYIAAHKHLPDIPSEAEVKTKGVNLGEMDALLLKKIEEITLYIIELKKENETLTKQNREFQERITELEHKL